MRVTFKRIIKAGYLSFRRNGWLSTATILVMVLVLFVMGNLIFLGAFANTVFNSLEDKIDVSVYFVPEASEKDILSMKEELETLADVEGTTYVSREEALLQFKERHQANALIVDALAELGDNPLQASLNVKAHDPSRYASISNYLLEKNSPLIDKINYFENQAVIERLGSIVSAVRTGGAFIALILAFIAVLVAFNTVRLAIYTMREEIGIMRLVGATKWFIRGPFIVSGVLYGSIAAFIATLVFFPLAWVSAPKLMLLVPSFDIFQYFLTNFLEFFAIMLATGIILGVLSSSIAIRRYLEA